MNLAYLFSGQGSQYVGMHKIFIDYKSYSEKYFKISNELLGYNILDIIKNGPLEKINNTKYTQPSIFIISAIAYNIFKDKTINLVSIASYDNYHYSQIIKSLNSNKNIIVEKPMCLNQEQLKNIYYLLKKKKNIKMTSNLVLRVNSLFKNFKKKLIEKMFFILKLIIFGEDGINYLVGDQKLKNIR